MSSTKTHPYVPAQAQNKVPQAQTTPTSAYNQSIPEAQVAGGPKYVNIQSRQPVVLTSCPYCTKEQVETTTTTKATGTTWACCGAGVLIFWPLCWVPLCIKGAKQTNHYCGHCYKKVGRVKPFN